MEQRITFSQWLGRVDTLLLLVSDNGLVDYRSHPWPEYYMAGLSPLDAVDEVHELTRAKAPEGSWKQQ